MDTELQFVTYKDFVESLPARTSATSGDKTVVSNSTDGLGSETNAAQAQKVLAGNIAQAFDPNKPNDAGGYAYYKHEVVAYSGATYKFKVNHSSGAWNAAEVESFSIANTVVNSVKSIAREYDSSKEGGYAVGSKFTENGELKIVKTFIPQNTQDISSYVDDSDVVSLVERIEDEKKNNLYFVKIGSNFYRCVKIGRLLWMAENLREPIGVAGTDYFVAYGEDGEKYGMGLLYKWGCICNSDGSISDALSAMLTGSGWRVPTRTDATKLAQNVTSGKELLTPSSLWNLSDANDKYGFGMLPVGYWNGSSVSKSKMAFIWTSTSASSANAYDMYFQGTGVLNTSDNSSKTSRAFSVRLCLDLNHDGSIPLGNGVEIRRVTDLPINPVDKNIFLMNRNGVMVWVDESEVNLIRETTNHYGFNRGVFYQSTGKTTKNETCTAVIELEAGFDYSLAVGGDSAANAFHSTDWVYAESPDGTITEINTTTVSASSGYVRLYVNLRKSDNSVLSVMDVDASYVEVTKIGYVKKFITSLDEKSAEDVNSTSAVEFEYRELRAKLDNAIEAVNSAVGARLDSSAGEDTISLVHSAGGKFIFNLHKRSQGDYGKYNDFYFPNAREDFGDVQFFDQNGKRLASKFVSKLDFDIVPDARLKIYKKVRTTSGGTSFGISDNRLVKSSDNGVTWLEVSAFSGEKFVPIFVTSSDTLLASDTNGDVYRSEAPYYSKTKVLNLYSVYGEALSTGPYQIDADSSGNLYLGTYKTSYGNNKVFKSSDDGETWTAVLSENNYQHIHHVYVDKSQAPNAIYVGFDGGGQNNEYNGGIFKSTDGGSSWADLRQEGLDIPQTTDHGVIYAGSGFRLLGGESSTINYSASIIRTENDFAFDMAMSNGKAVFSVASMSDGTLIGCANSSGNYRSSELIMSKDNGKTWKSILCSSFDGSGIEDGGLNTISVVGDELWIYSNNSAAKENVNRRVISGRFAEVIVDVPAGVTTVTAKCGYVLPDLKEMYNDSFKSGDVFYEPLNDNDSKNIVFVGGLKKIVDNDYVWVESDASRIGSIYPAIQSPADRYAAVIKGTTKNLYDVTIPTTGIHIGLWIKFRKQSNGRVELISSREYSIFVSQSRVGYFDGESHFVSYPLSVTPRDTFQRLDITIDGDGDCRCFVNGKYVSNGSGFDLSKLSGKIAFLSNDSKDDEWAVQHFSVSSVIPSDSEIEKAFYYGINDNMDRT